MSILQITSTASMLLRVIILDANSRYKIYDFVLYCLGFNKAPVNGIKFVLKVQTN